MSKLFLESLDVNRLTVFNKLRNFRNIGILGGGTALALQIGHRKSFDFDIFVNQKIDKRLWQKAKGVFGENSIKILDSEDQLNLNTPEGIGITFFLDDYQNLFPAVLCEQVNLMSVKDIAANKAMLQGKRPKWRDYVDLYSVLKGRHIGLQELIKASKRKFENDFSEKLFLEQLVYWNDISDYTIEFVGHEVLKEEIKNFLEKEVKIYKEKFLGKS